MSVNLENTENEQNGSIKKARYDDSTALGNGDVSDIHQQYFDYDDEDDEENEINYYLSRLNDDEEDSMLDGYSEDQVNDTLTAHSTSAGNHKSFSYAMNGSLNEKADKGESAKELYTIIKKPGNIKFNYDYMCKQCGLVCSSTKEILNHFINVHGKTFNVYECPDCNYATRYRANIYRHIHKEHKDTIPTINLANLKAKLPNETSMPQAQPPSAPINEVPAQSSQVDSESNREKLSTKYSLRPHIRSTIDEKEASDEQRQMVFKREKSFRNDKSTPVNQQKLTNGHSFKRPLTETVEAVNGQLTNGVHSHLKTANSKNKVDLSIQSLPNHQRQQQQHYSRSDHSLNGRFMSRDASYQSVYNHDYININDDDDEPEINGSHNFYDVRARMNRLERKVAALDTYVSNFDTRLSNIDSRIVRIEDKLERIMSYIDGK